MLRIIPYTIFFKFKEISRDFSKHHDITVNNLRFDENDYNRIGWVNLWHKIGGQNASINACLCFWNIKRTLTKKQKAKHNLKCVWTLKNQRPANQTLKKGDQLRIEDCQNHCSEQSKEHPWTLQEDAPLGINEKTVPQAAEDGEWQGRRKNVEVVAPPWDLSVEHEASSWHEDKPHKWQQRAALRDSTEAKITADTASKHLNVLIPTAWSHWNNSEYLLSAALDEEARMGNK